MYAHPNVSVQRHVPIIRVRPTKPYIRRHFDLAGMHDSIHFREHNAHRTTWCDLSDTRQPRSERAGGLMLLSDDCMARYDPDRCLVEFIVHTADDIRHYQFEHV